MIAPILGTTDFVTGQVAASTLTPAQTRPGYVCPATEQMLALQLSNMFGLVMLLGLGILNTTDQPRVVHAYVFALWVADIGHVGSTAYVLGMENLLDVASWNATTWGNVGITTFLFAIRSLYFVGLLGPDHDPRRKPQRKRM